MIGIGAGLLLFAVNLPLYLLPSILGRKKQNRAAIFAVNFLLGWTIVGWFAALIWALGRDAQSIPASPAVARFCHHCANFSMPGSRVCRSCGKPFESEGQASDFNAA